MNLFVWFVWFVDKKTPVPAFAGMTGESGDGAALTR
jgi:hypothetical protein